MKFKMGQKKAESFNTALTSGVSCSVWDDPERRGFQPSREEDEWTGGYVEQEVTGLHLSEGATTNNWEV